MGKSFIIETEQDLQDVFDNNISALERNCSIATKCNESSNAKCKNSASSKCNKEK